MQDRELERELQELGSHIEYPPTPDLARAVRRSLDQEGTGQQTRSRRLWSSLPSLRWTAAATAFLLIVAVPVLSPTMRATVAGWLEAGQTASSGQAARGSSPVESKGSTAEAPSDAGGEAMPSSGGRHLEEGLGFGERVTLREARSLAGAPVLVPRTEVLGEPDEVYAGGTRGADRVVLVYRSRPGLPPLEDAGIGLVLTERAGGVEETDVRPEFQRVEVGGERGYWAPAARDAGILGGGVLLWEQEGLALRLESNLSKEEAIRVAGSVR